MVRKTHTKSRKGCTNCKRRHVKCDEKKPSCSHCVRLEIDCQYPDTRASTTFVTHSHSPGPDATGTPRSSALRRDADGTPTLPIHELRLLHFWVLNTSLTCSARSQAPIYQTVVVELGFQHQYLLHGIFAVAALHKAVIYPSERKELVLTSNLHYDVAISAYRRLLNCPDPATCVPVFMLSGLLHMHILGFAQVSTPVDAIDDICTWIRIIRGVRTSVGSNWDRLRASEVAPVFATITKDRVPKTEHSEVLILKELANKIEDLEAREIYFEVIEELHLVFLHVRLDWESTEKWTIAMTLSWAAVVPVQFVDLLAVHDQLALIILSHYAVLFEYQKRLWWMNGWSTWAQEAIHRHLDKGMLEWTEWPRSQCPEVI